MLFAKLKMTLSLESPIPLGNVSREQAEANLAKEGGEDAFKTAMFAHLKESLGEAGVIELIDCTVKLVEV